MRKKKLRKLPTALTEPLTHKVAPVCSPLAPQDGPQKVGDLGERVRKCIPSAKMFGDLDKEQSPVVRPGSANGGTPRCPAGAYCPVRS